LGGVDSGCGLPISHFISGGGKGKKRRNEEGGGGRRGRDAITLYIVIQSFRPNVCREKKKEKTGKGGKKRGQPYPGKLFITLYSCISSTRGKKKGMPKERKGTMDLWD